MARKQVWRMVIYIAAIIAAVLHMTSCAAIPGFQECILNNQRYSIGEVFHPVVTINGRSYEAVCYQCTCQPTTIAQCEEINCPPANCSNPIRLDGECCPICIAPEISTDRGDASCMYDGIIFQSGESFHPPAMVQAYENSENTTAGNPYCIECECYDGSVECGDISGQCPRLGCNESEAVLPSGSCCKQCPRPVHTPEPASGCTDFDGRFFQEGESWHPTLPDHGVVTCINCTCVNNQAACEKLPCPEVPPCSPDYPVPAVVLCCPECTPVSTRSPSNDTSNTTYSNNTTSPTTITDISPAITPCQSPYSYKVYQSTNYDCMAMEDTLTGEVEVYKWFQTSNGIVREFRSISYTEFAVDEQYSDFIFVGWALARRVNGLTTRTTRRRKIEDCMRNCSHLVVNILRPVTEYTETLQC